ncbi:hypothetical protein SRABI106_01134 [Rahnella aquatilis]|nr:hypothetical protein SRABI106_01134 [Rahnella aquatilis]
MVRPARITDPHASGAGLCSDEIRCDTQSAGAARSLCGACPFISNNRAVFAKQQFLCTTGKIRQPVDTQIGFSGFIFQQELFGFFHAGQNRRFTCFVFINTNPQIDFIRAVVSAEKIGKTQDRVSRCCSDFFKHVGKFHSLILRKRPSG